MVEPLAAWMLSALVHGGLWLGGAWLVCRLRPKLASRHRDLLWKTALLGSLLGPTVQTVAGIEPLGGRFLLGAAAAVPATGAPEPERAGLALPTDPERLAALAALLEARQVRAADDAEGLFPALERPQTRRGILAALLCLWLIGALARVLAGAGAGRRLRLLLRDRDELLDGDLHRRFERLRRRSGAGRVRLSSCDRLVSPIAFGVLRPEVCLPTRALSDLSPAQQDSMLGHELAHHLRRDPLWLLLFAAAERLLFFQPLNRLAHRRAQEAAEELCDAWSARHAADGLAMASCLTEIAGWFKPPADLLPAPAMARPGGALGQRVAHLVAAAPQLTSAGAGRAAPPARPRIRRGRPRTLLAARRARRGRRGGALPGTARQGGGTPPPAVRAPARAAAAAEPRPARSRARSDSRIPHRQPGLPR